MGFLTAGLLKGLGSGLAMEAEQRRENALIALRRQYQQEDIAATETRTIAAEGRAEDRDIRKDEREFGVKKELVEIAQRYKQQENETNQQYEERLIRLRADEDRKSKTWQGNIDKTMEKLKHQFNLTELQAKEAAELASDLEKAGKVADHWEVTSDGRLVGVSSTGQVIARSRNAGSFIPSRGGNADDGDDTSGGTIAGARARTGGGEAPTAAKPTPAPKADPNSNERATALARLGNVYHHATPEEYPGLFRNGKKISMEEAKRLIRERYP